MKQTEEIILMLNQIPNPAFLVKDGMILHVNPAAHGLMIPTGTAVQELFITGQQEYAEFQCGSLYLTLRICGIACNASVNRTDHYDLFVLDHEDDLMELQSMALAAQELRAPLSSVMSIADSLFPLIGENEDHGAQEKLARINRGLFQMLRIVSNMSDAYRYSKDLAPRLEVRDIGSILDSLFFACIPLVQQSGLNLHYSGLSERIYCLVDAEKLERAVHNLISNALKFTPAGGTMDARLVRKENMLYLTIQSNSSATPGRFPDNAFRLYRRGPGLEDSRFGIGLGMVLIRGAAAAHGGTVLLDKTPEHGTRITLTLAIRQSGDPNVRASILSVDYAGERDHGLVELSDSLPIDLYYPEKIN